MGEIENNLKLVYENIGLACLKVGKDPKSLRLLAASKMFSAKNVQEAADAGQLFFAENYVQEAKSKISELREAGYLNLSFDLIGNLQRNKVKAAVGLFDCMQTVDRLGLAEEISKVAGKKNLLQKILLQINVSEEETKSGIFPKKALELVLKISKLPNISVDGLMSVGKFYDASEKEALRREQFVKMRELRDKIRAESGLELTELSMGMSNDYQLAIEEGATIVRVGSAIFGERQN